MIRSPLGEFLGDLFPTYASFGHEDHHMIQQITDLIFYFIGIGILGGDNDLGRLLAKLLKYLIKSLVKEIIGIRALFGIGLTV